MDWTRHGADWPNRSASRFVRSRPHMWHVQEMGTGRCILLLHGTGAATHSWRDLLTPLAAHARVIAPDLPGHAFTRLGTRRRSSLAEMAADVAALCATLDARPALIVGHSAGAAIAVRMAAVHYPGASIVGINAALGGFRGSAAWLFPALARALATLPFVSDTAALVAPPAIDRLLASTGSRVDARGRALYRLLAGQPSHVEGALLMMSQWSTGSLGHGLAELDSRVLLLVGSKDPTVPPRVSREAARLCKRAELGDLGPLGHLAHEEAPDRVSAMIRAALARDIA